MSQLNNCVVDKAPGHPERNTHISNRDSSDESAPGRLMTRDEARRIAANIRQAAGAAAQATDLYQPASAMTSTPDISLHCAH
jgi:hypothetical protein